MCNFSIIFFFKLHEQFDLWFSFQVICVIALMLFFIGFSAICINDNHLFFVLLAGEIMMFGLCLLLLSYAALLNSSFAIIFALSLLAIAAIDSAIGLSFTLLFFIVNFKYTL